MTYSIWLEPINKDWVYLKNIIDNLAKKCDSPIFEPHVTIDSEIKKLPPSRNLIESLQNISKVKINSLELKHSNYIWKTLFIQLENNFKLDQIRKNLRNQLCFKSKYNFDPHISLIYKKMDKSKKEEIISKLNIKSEFIFDKISIINSSDEVKNWSKIFTYKLKN